MRTGRMRKTAADYATDNKHFDIAALLVCVCVCVCACACACACTSLSVCVSLYARSGDVLLDLFAVHVRVDMYVARACAEIRRGCRGSAERRRRRAAAAGLRLSARAAVAR